MIEQNTKLSGKVKLDNKLENTSNLEFVKVVFGKINNFSFSCNRALYDQIRQ